MATDSVMATWADCGDDLKVEIFENIGKWAVDEYNKEHGTHLVFVNGFVAQRKRLIDGTVLYKLLLVVKDDDGRLKRCEALVLVKRDGRKKLLAFHFVKINQEIIGEWTDAGNDVELEKLAKWAVDEYNKKEGTTLEFKELKNAQIQLVDGILYRLTLEAIDDGHTNGYQAIVLVVPWELIKELEEFKQLLLNVED